MQKRKYGMHMHMHTCFAFGKYLVIFLEVDGPEEDS